VGQIETRMKKQGYLIEIITILLYICAIILIMHYHEPRYDEAQAWLIARGATIKELLTSITHYEGHPPFWFLILMPFAKLGVPFEIGLKAINFTFVTVAMGIFIFKAPFNRFIRCTIPFTYFFFYQYGVISRPYSLMMLGFVLSALLYKERNEKPYRFTAALSVICAASAFGMIIAAGISLVWLWEIFDKTISLDKIKIFIKSKMFYAIVVLFIFNVLILVCIYPYSDAYGIAANQKNPYFAMLLYMFFIAPAEAIFFNGLSVLGNSAGVNSSQLIYLFIIGYILNIALFVITKRFKKLALFIVPYCMFSFFAGKVYFWHHHLGIIAMFYMFLLWCCFDDKKLIYKSAEKKYLTYIGVVLVIIAIATSIYASVAASFNDIKLNYGIGREVAEFISDNKLDHLNILTAWKIINPDEKYYDYNAVLGVDELAYFDKNIFYNLNHGLNNKCYLTHKLDVKGNYTKGLIQNNYPDILLGTSDDTYTFGTEINMDDFVLVKSFYGNTIWKASVIEDREFIYIRKDLLKNYPNLKPLNFEEEKVHKIG
jgi:hypothetical protein